MLLNALARRERGLADALRRHQPANRLRLLLQLELDPYHDLESTAAGGSVRSLNIDICERRFLLAGFLSRRIAIYDLNPLDKLDCLRYRQNSQQNNDGVAGVNSGKLRPLHTVGPAHKDCHGFSVETVSWYPVDSGIFFSSSNDGYIKVWDANNLVVASSLDLKSPIFCHHISSLVSSQLLVATGLRSGVRLYDVRTNAATHQLLGHRDEVVCVQWSPTNDTLLATSGADGCLYLWDVRKARSMVHSFDRDAKSSSSADSSATSPPKRSRLAAETTSFSSSNSATKHIRRERELQRRRLAAIESEQATSYSQGLANCNPFLEAGDRMIAGKKFLAHSAGINGMTFTGSGEQLLTFGLDQRLRLWNCRSGLLEEINFGRETVNNGTSNAKLELAVASPGGGRHLAFVPCADEIWMYDLDSGNLLDRLKAHFGDVNSICNDESRSAILSAGRDQNILTWNGFGWQNDVRTAAAEWHCDHAHDRLFEPNRYRSMPGLVDGDLLPLSGGLVLPDSWE